MALKAIVVILLVPLLFASIFIHQLLKVNYASSLKLAEETITIKRDEHNIPQIHAPSFHSAMYAWGFVTAEDRLFQLAFRRVSVKGELSKYLGAKAIDIDKMFRELDLYGWAVRSAERFKRQNITQYKHFEAYAQGINDYYKSITFRPLQFYMIGLKWEDWTVADMFALYKLIKWSLSFGMMEQYIRSSLLANFTKQQIDSFLPYEPKYWLNGDESMHTTIIKDHEIPQDILHKSLRTNLKDFKPVAVQKMVEVGFFQYLDVNQRASNSWVIGGNHTESGHPILCNDPHLDSSLPGEWHQIKVYYANPKGGEYYIIGGAIVGLPTIVGKTSYVAVTMTTNYVDSQDLFKEKVEGDKYMVNGQWRQLKVRNQKIQVKGGQTIQYAVYQTHRGPIIKHIGSKGYLYKVEEPLSLCWVGFTDAEHMSLSKYVHLAEFESHADTINLLHTSTDYGPHFNLLYATADDHIGYYAIGLIPLRRHPHMGMYVKDGTNSDNDWIGFIRGSDKLHMEDPQRGYIVSANNKAASAKYFSGVLDISIYTARATRIQNLIQQQIKSGRKITKDFMKSIQLDTVDSYCLWLVEGIRKKVLSDQRYKFVYSLFDRFACNFSTFSTTSCFYITFLQNLYEQLHPQGFNSTQKFNLANFHHFHQYMYTYLLKQHNQDDLKLLNASLFDGLKQLRTHFKSQISSTFKYGELHRDHMIHRPFSFVQPIKHLFQYEGPGFGNMNTPNVGFMYRFHDKDYRTNHRANIRVILSFFQDSEWIVDGGTSQRFYSRHYRDQTQKFMAGKYLIMDSWNKTNAIV